MGAVFGLTIVGILAQATLLALVIELIRMTGQDMGWWGGAATGALTGVCLAAMGAVLGAWA
ncbi:MAG: hypothetical protein ACYC90_06480 [Candidatus Nanopelagicales bacterium]